MACSYLTLTTLTTLATLATLLATSEARSIRRSTEPMEEVVFNLRSPPAEIEARIASLLEAPGLEASLAAYLRRYTAAMAAQQRRLVEGLEGTANTGALVRGLARGRGEEEEEEVEVLEVHRLQEVQEHSLRAK